MSPRPNWRTQDCTKEQARIRLDQAQAFLQVAELLGDETDDLAHPGVAAALAVLAGIAASDAACCAVLGQRSRGQDHRQAVELLAGVGPDGRMLARTLDRLLDLKDGAHYGLVFVSAHKAAAAVRQARALVEAATTLVR